MKTKPEKHRVNIVTLGCSKNQIDSEKLMKQFEANGLQVVHNDNSTNADSVFINTCGFIKDAKEESIDTILQFARAKEKGDIKNLYVIGCLSERYKADLEKEITEVNRFFGTNNIQEIIAGIGYNYKEHLAGERILTNPSHYAYIKISEGCDRHCSFCAIPLMRGKYKSRTVQEILTEAQNLANSGVKELILIAQDLSYYGVDLYKKQVLSELLIQLADIDKLEWIRLHYAYPAGFPKNVLNVMQQNTNVCNYLDIPFQHISNPVLKKMRRGITRQQTYDLIQHIRDTVPDITLRTTLMVGHPGEGQGEFEELQEFVERVRFNRLGVFTYSEEEDTYGSRNFPDSIPAKIKQERAEKIMNRQREISGDLNRKMIGKHIRILVDRQEEDYYVGRTEGDSPEVDNEVIIHSKTRLIPGSFYHGAVISAGDYDLVAVI